MFTAHMLKHKHSDASIAIADGHAGQNGASVRNAGFACFGSPSEVLHDVEIMEEDAALGLLKKRWQGIRFIEKHFSVACDFQKVMGYEVFPDSKKALFEKCVQALPDLNQKLNPITGYDDTYKVDETHHGFKGLENQIHIKGEGQLNPAKLHQHLRKQCLEAGVVFYDSFEATSLEMNEPYWRVDSQSHSLKARCVINCTNGFTHSWISMPEVQPARAQVLITKPMENMPVQGNFHMDEGFYYFRNVGSRLLLGGARNADVAGETTTQLEVTNQIQTILGQVLRSNILPNHTVEIEHRWSGIMGMRSNKKPSVEMHHSGLWSIVGLSGMGVALAPMLAKELVEKL